jgi:uncharacterized protein (TIRG00374 family)
MKIAIRSLLLITCAALILWLMGRANLIDFTLIMQAITNSKGFVLLTIAIQTIIFILLMWRYVLTVRAFKVRVPTKDMAAATFVSVAIGQWAPGAMAIMEVIRMGLMFGTNRNSATESGVKPRLIAASLYDRLIGFMVILFIGFLSSMFLIAKQLSGNALFADLLPLIGLAAFSLVGTAAIIAMPFLARISASKKLLLALHKYFGGTNFSYKIWPQLLQRILSQLENLRHVLAAGDANLTTFLSPSLVSLVGSILMSVTTYTAALAVGTPIPLMAILASFPVIAIASLIPMGFAGMGGYQLVTIAVLHVFGVDAKVAASANLLQTALSLLTSTALGLLYLRPSIGQMRALLAKRTEVRA